MDRKIEQMKLTQRHILHGEPDTCKECPVAMMLQENGYPDAHVSSTQIALNGMKFIYKIGKRLQNWIANYDKRFRVEPVRITICHTLNTIEITS